MYLLVLLATLAAAPVTGPNSGAPRSSSVAEKKDSLSAADENLQPSVVFGRAAPSVLVVLATVKEGTSLGSGVVVGKDLIVTNAHVVEGAASITVKQGKRSWPATLNALDREHDLAILKVAELERPAVALRESSLLTVGERAYAIGAPQGLELSLTDGLVSSVRKEGPATGVQTSAPISKGIERRWAVRRAGPSDRRDDLLRQDRPELELRGARGARDGAARGEAHSRFRHAAAGRSAAGVDPGGATGSPSL
ncbi:MAG: serine protease [Myxococcales bacterium]